MNFSRPDQFLACHTLGNENRTWGPVNMLSLDDKSCLLLVWWWTIHPAIEHFFRKCMSFKTCSELGRKLSLTNFNSLLSSIFVKKQCVKNTILKEKITCLINCKLGKPWKTFFTSRKKFQKPLKKVSLDSPSYSMELWKYKTVIIGYFWWRHYR